MLAMVFRGTDGLIRRYGEGDAAVSAISDLDCTIGRGDLVAPMGPLERVRGDTWRIVPVASDTSRPRGGTARNGTASLRPNTMMSPQPAEMSFRPNRPNDGTGSRPPKGYHPSYHGPLPQMPKVMRCT